QVIYVDAVMYPGFSGGALINTAGAVIGMVTSGLGIGGQTAAIPWSQAARIGRQLSERGRVERGYLGVQTQPIELSGSAVAEGGGRRRGLLVLEIHDGGPAASAGILQGDIIVEVAGAPVPDVEEFPGEM